jgi:lipopolysaccharide transport system permease protein
MFHLHYSQKDTYNNIMHDNPPLVVYEPDSSLKAGLFSLYAQMFSDLQKSGELGYRLFLRDFRARYRQSLLGALWVVIVPLFTVGIFIAINRAGVFRSGDTGVPYPVFALFGVTVWSLFSGLTSSISGVVGSTGGLITKINFPRIALVYPPVLISFVDFGVRFLLLFVIMITGRVALPAGALLFPLSLLPLILLSIGIGMALSIVGALFRDIANFVAMFLTLAMLLTPVVYTMPTGGFLLRVNLYNPLYYLIDVPRTLLFSGVLGHPTGFVVSSAIAAVVFFLGWRFYQLAIGRIVEKV